jgi:beta-glucosidase-like glycosyl hydrolase/CubicO group peptidase (beta-lactamase class C family)
LQLSNKSENKRFQHHNPNEANMIRAIAKQIMAVILLFFLSLPNLSAQTTDHSVDHFDLHQHQGNAWVDSVFNSLSLKERIAQSMVIRTFSNRDRAFYDSISRIIIKYNIGGLCFFQGDPQQQAQLTKYWQVLSKTPLLITIDAEWGLGMRLKNAWSFPKQMTLGAVTDNELIYRMAYKIGQHCKSIGTEMNFAPVVDINSNPANPVINFRSFGEDPQQVAIKGAAYIRGLQDAGVMACAKHFPGHGDTDSDSHYTLPLLNHNRQVIDSIDLVPFRKAMEAHVSGIMTAHLFIPALDARKNMATSLSDKAIDSLMKQVMGFDGLAVTDALDMKGVTASHQIGEIEKMAYLAGNDILLLPLAIGSAIDKIIKAIEQGEISGEEIDARCRKILTYKYITGLYNFDYDDIDIDKIPALVNDTESELITRQIYEKAITIVKNHRDLLPLQRLDTLRIASVAIGSASVSTFQKTLELYAPVTHFQAGDAPTAAEISNLRKQLQNYNLIIISLESPRLLPRNNYSVTQAALQLVAEIKSLPSHAVLDIFGNAYLLKSFADNKNLDAIVMSYENNDLVKEVSAQMLFGATGAFGSLPVTVTSTYPAGTGLITRPLARLRYSIPEEVGIDHRMLDTLDRLIEKAIREKAFPGAQMLLAKDGVVFYNKSFGNHIYNNERPVQHDDLYDLASLTKILATTPAIMELQDEGLFDIDQPLSVYLPYLQSSNKSGMITRDAMTHQARLQAWIPFYIKTIIDYKPDKRLYHSKPEAGYTTQVADKLYILDLYRDSIFDTITSSKLLKKKEYKYSDLGFILLYDAIQKITATPMDVWMQNEFYKPLGMTTMGYLPRQRFDLNRIVPTENDTIFRKQLVHGYVHDPGAAMLGGVSGHAGLFANANDVAKMMQMYLQKGFYGGRQYIKPETMEEFTRQQFPLDDNRRGIGFDKPLPVYDRAGPACKGASAASFGHSGFTGTYAWADPDHQLVYIFLSNRVYPDAGNNGLTKSNLRTKLHQLVYDIIKASTPATTPASMLLNKD